MTLWAGGCAIASDPRLSDMREIADALDATLEIHLVPNEEGE